MKKIPSLPINGFVMMVMANMFINEFKKKLVVLIDC